MKGMTIVREIIAVDVELLSLNVSSRISLGIYLLNDDARSAGAFPDPESDVDKGWLWRTTRLWRTTAGMDPVMHLTADIRTPRDFGGPSNNLVLLGSVPGGDSNLQVGGLVRVLAMKA